MTCIIIDDEQPAREELVYLLSDYDDIRILDQADSASKAISSIKKNQPDFIFLDIHMPGKSGFDVIPEIIKMNCPPLVIFVTAYDQYAVKAFEKNAIDYIMKPFSQNRLEQSLDRVRNLLALKNEDQKNKDQKNKELIHKNHTALVETAQQINKIKKISVELNGRLQLINPDDIMFCQYADKKISVYANDEIYTLYGMQTMDQLELHLKAYSFFRSHRNTIINFDYIKEFSPWFHGKYHITMNDQKKTEMIIPRERVRLFKQHLGI